MTSPSSPKKVVVLALPGARELDAAVAGSLFGFKAVDVLWVSTGFFLGVIAFRPQTW